MTQVVSRHRLIALLATLCVCLVGLTTVYAQEDKSAPPDNAAAKSTSDTAAKATDQSVASKSDADAQDSAKPADATSAKRAKTAKGQSDAVDPLKRPLSTQEKKANEKRFKQEVSGAYKKWLDEDVRWIITDEERSAFKQLSNDEERDQFIEAFWQRRDPTPDTIENEFKEEHYRRIAYANEHFAAGIPGWKSDRGRMYIMYGPADEIDSHPSGGTYERPMEEGGGETSTFPFEDWRYRYLEGIGQEVII
jgi:GWxTD domain-containing protein